MRKREQRSHVPKGNMLLEGEGGRETKERVKRRWRGEMSKKARPVEKAEAREQDPILLKRDAGGAIEF